MRDVKQLTAAFADHGGLYLPLAQKLAQSYKRVIYFDPCEKAFPKINDAVIGDGFDNIERVDNFWQFKDEINLFVFPDSQGVGLQKELASQGFPVWGSFDSETIEQSREKFHRILGQVGLEVPKFERIVGLTALRDHLKDEDDKYIKISKYRGSLETCHFRSMDEDAGMLDLWAVKFGGVKDQIAFLVFDAIETNLEIGGDTYNIGGQWPQAMFDGFEYKDKGYFAAWKKFEDMPDHTKAVMEAFGPVLADHGHANFWSMEIRVDDDKFYFIDATPRGPLPSTGSQMENITNLAEVIAAGAEREMVEPENEAMFAAECVLTQKAEKDAWGSVRVPSKLSRWMKLGGSCLVDGRTWFPPGDPTGEEIGWLVALGDTPKETIETMLDQAKELPDGVSANTDSLVELLKVIRESEAEGIKFSDQEVPEPAIAIEE